MTRSARLVLLLPLATIPACLQFFPEASLRSDGSLVDDVERVERAMGAHFKVTPSREARPDAAVLEAADRSLLSRPAGGSGAFDDAVFAMFRSSAEAKAPSSSALPRGPHAPAYTYDPELSRLIVPDGNPQNEDPRTARSRDLARVDALARALLCQRYDLKALQGTEKKSSRDFAEGLIGAVVGGAHAGVLDASLSPIGALDAGEQSIRRYHDALTERLLADPEGAPARELARSDVPDAERRELEALLETSGLQRRRQILRVFAAARLYLEARDRVSTGNLEAVYDDPPRSSEQLLHPERYLDSEDNPIEITEGRRPGLIGIAYQLESTQVAGEFGLRNALEGALTPHEAANACEGWGGDLLSVYRQRDTGERAFAWRFECDDRFAARRLRAALERAVALHEGGEFVEIEPDLMELQGGSRPCHLKRKDAALAFVLGGRTELHHVAIDSLLTEVAARFKGTTLAANHDPAYRLVRAAASPFFFDSPGRFDSRSYSLYGFAFRHRRALENGEFELVNWSEFPFADRFLPLDMYGMLFSWERGDLRHGWSFLQEMVRSSTDEVRDRSRFWSPFVSWIRGPEYDETSVLYGLLFTKGDGAGRSELSPRIVYSNASELDGAKTRQGVLFDAVSHASAAGYGSRTELLPYGALAEFESRDDPHGFGLGFFFDALAMRRAKTLPDQPSFEFSLLWRRGARFFQDDASGAREVSLLSGMVFGHFGEPRRHGTGFGRFFDRYFLGFGAEDGRWFMDALWFRLGG